MKTYTPKAKDIVREWYLVDAAGHNLGRLASEVAQILKGKHKVIYSPHLDVGDFVIIVNAAKIQVTGNKGENKLYYRHSGYPGGLYVKTAAQTRSSKPEFLVRHAVRGMLPKTTLGKQMLKKLYVYTGSQHKHNDKFTGNG